MNASKTLPHLVSIQNASDMVNSIASRQKNTTAKIFEIDKKLDKLINGSLSK